MAEATVVDFDVQPDPNANSVVATFWLEGDQGPETKIVRLSREEAEEFAEQLAESPEQGVTIEFSPGGDAER